MDFTVCTDPAALGLYYTFGDGKPQPRPLRFLSGAGASVVALKQHGQFGRIHAKPIVAYNDCEYPVRCRDLQINFSIPVSVGKGI